VLWGREEQSQESAVPIEAMTPEIALVLGVLGVTVLLFVTEALRIDIVALLVMVALPWLGLIPAEDAFTGLSSGAVVSIMAILVMGFGLERTGVTSHLAAPIVRLGGDRPRRTLAACMLMVGVMSAFMQNVGAAALFLPVGLRVARINGLPPSRVLMPIGFAAILGGTLSMVGSSPLILLGDLLSEKGLEQLPLFAVTPIGVVLLLVGVALFAILGPSILPDRSAVKSVYDAQRALVRSWAIIDNIEELMIPRRSTLVGVTRHDASLILRYGVHVLAVRQLGRTSYAPKATHVFESGQRISLLGRPEDIERLVNDHKLRRRARPQIAEMWAEDRAGYAELLISPRASIVGKALRDVHVRARLGIEPLALLSGGEEVREFADVPLKPGDVLVVHGLWKNIRAVQEDDDFVLLSHAPAPIETGKALRAAACFLAAVSMTLAGVPLPLAFLSGAVAMILTRVVAIDEAYRAVSWPTVFLLAGLIPLGVAMQRTGAAAYVAQQMMGVLDGSHPLAILFTVGALTTVFTLFMSNVAATVVLVPLAMDLGLAAGLDPRAMALLVGVCAQNSFVLPTHQVNALLMTPGGYRNVDYLKTGGLMTLVFLPLAVLGIWLLWL